MSKSSSKYSIYTRCLDSKDGYHVLIACGMPLSGDTWYECKACGKLLEREIINVKEKNTET
jgi:hypothetical protein